MRTRDQNATPVDDSSKKATVDRKSPADTVVDDKSNLLMAARKSPDMAVSKSHLVTVVKNNLVDMEVVVEDVAPASTVDVETMMMMMRTEVSDDMVVEDVTMMMKTWTSTVSVAAATKSASYGLDWVLRDFLVG